jgi:hypothetical protein
MRKEEKGKVKRENEGKGKVLESLTIFCAFLLSFFLLFSIFDDSFVSPPAFRELFIGDEEDRKN